MTFAGSYRRRAKVLPKNLATLRPACVPMIGKVYNFRWAGSGEGTQFPTQQVWVPAIEHDHEIPPDARGLWFPDEDLQDVTQ